MTNRQFEKALEKAGFCKPLPNGTMSKGQVEFAAAIKVNERTVRNWVSGRSEVPTSIAMLLNLMIETASTAKDLKA